MKGNHGTEGTMQDEKGGAGVPVPHYPESARGEVVDVIHGVRVPDPWRWLEDPDAPETAAWIRAQNAVTDQHLDALPRRGHFRERLRSLWNHERYSLPFTEGARTFYLHNPGLRNQPVLCVEDAEGAPARILVDPQELSADGTVALTLTEGSPDGALLVYGVTSGGSDWQEFRIRDVATGADLPEVLRWVKFSGVAWTRDGKGFFYGRYPEPVRGAMVEANRDMRLYYHRVGTPQSEDLLVLERPDHPEWGFGAMVTEDGRWLLVSVWHGTDPRNRLLVASLGDPAAPTLTPDFVALAPEPLARMDPVEVIDGRLYLVTDLDAPRRRVVAVDLPGYSGAPPEQWPTVVAEADSVLEGASLLGGRLVLQRLRDAAGELVVHALDGELLDRIALPAVGSVTGVSGHPSSSTFFYGFTSYLHPQRILRHDLDHGHGEAFRVPRVDFDPGPFVTEQHTATSSDGTRIPYFLTRRRDARPDGTHRVLAYGYGGFGVALAPAFSSSQAVWLEEGGMVMVMNLRGGGEFGEEWHREGTLERKQNVFDDCIACVEALIEAGWTRAGQVALQGASNGGLLVGAVVNQRPELFGVALPAVGVMDMLRFHRFTIGWAWVSDYGSAEDPELFPVLLRYSPLHNVRSGVCHPATLITTGDHDDRVVPGHSFKYAAALQSAQGCAHPVLIRIETRAGHGAGKPTDKLIEEGGDILAFLDAHLPGG
jgi:prolyl oligopeptidase